MEGVNNLWLVLVPKAGPVHSRELFINGTVDGIMKKDQVTLSVSLMV